MSGETMAEGAAQPPVQAEGILGPPAAKLAVRTERIPRQPVARPPVDALQLRVATTVGDQDGTAFERAVKLVTGQDVDLRGPATPRNGWVATGVPLGGGGWGFAAGDVRFSVSRNERARTAWRDAVWVYENIDHEVFSGRFGLMDVRRLRDAEQLTNDRMNRISTTVDEIKRMTDRVDKSNLAGSAASMLAAKLHELGEHTREQRDVLAEPPPTVPGVLHDAAEALAECGRQLSYIWWESNQVLLNAPDYEIDAVRDNINSYLSMNGLGGTGDILATLGPPPAAPGQTPEGMPSGAAPIEQIRQVLARYDSTVAGGLPAGMDPIAGDLTLPPVWDAVNAAITKRITVELDKLDRVAGLQLEKLRKAYEAVTERLAGLGQRPLDRVPTVTPPRMQTAVRQRG